MFSDGKQMIAPAGGGGLRYTGLGTVDSRAKARRPVLPRSAAQERWARFIDFCGFTPGGRGAGPADHPPQRREPLVPFVVTVQSAPRAGAPTQRKFYQRTASKPSRLNGTSGKDRFRRRFSSGRSGSGSVQHSASIGTIGCIAEAQAFTDRDTPIRLR